MGTKYYLPGLGGQIDDGSGLSGMYQASPLLNTYSPRLFGAPPQLTHLNDMRLKSSNPNRPVKTHSAFRVSAVLPVRSKQVISIISCGAHKA